jgi:hypothetical protein
VSDRPDELRRQLATLWRAARTGIDTMKEIAVRSSEAGRLRFDIAMLQRERVQLLTELGKRTCEFLDGGSDRPIPAELHRLHDRIRDVEERIKSNSFKVYDNAFGAPRGYEPEAAVDYGDEHAVEDPSEEIVAPPPPRRSSTRKRASQRRKGSNGKH